MQITGATRNRMCRNLTRLRGLRLGAGWSIDWRTSFGTLVHGITNLAGPDATYRVFREFEFRRGKLPGAVCTEVQAGQGPSFLPDSARPGSQVGTHDRPLFELSLVSPAAAAV
jgi:hypothetical protein